MAKAHAFNVMMETQDADLQESAVSILREQHGVHGLRLLGRAATSDMETSIDLTVTSGVDSVSLIYEKNGSIFEEKADKDTKSIEYALSNFALAKLGLTLEDQSSRQDYEALSTYAGDRPQIEADPSKWVVENPLMSDLCRRFPQYGNMVRFLCNERGLFLKVGNFPNQRAYWNSTLNGGLPVFKKVDPIHEGTFMLHDLFHFVPVDPLLGDTEGNDSTKAAYIAHRLLSEASTLVLADMVAVADARLDQKGYDISKRKIFPVYESIREAQGGRPDTEKLLAANAYFCFTGDTAGFKSLGANDDVLEEYRDKYETIFRDDFLWNLQNFDAMTEEYATNPLMREYYTWIKTNTELPMLDDYSFDIITPAGEVDIPRLLSLFRADFMQALRYQEPVDDTGRTKLAYKKYLAGQRVVFARFGNDVSSDALRAAFDLNFTTLSEADSIENIRACATEMNQITDEYINSLSEEGILLPHDAATYRFTAPLYPVKFVNYEKNKSDNSHQLAESMKHFINTNDAHLKRLLDTVRS